LSKRKKARPEPEKAEYQPTDREIAALEQHIAHVAAAPTAPRLKVTKGDKASTFGVDHPDKPLAYTLLMEALGTVSIDFVNGLLTQLANAGSSGDEIDEAGINFLLSVVKGIKPKDQLEAMLAAQMAVVHVTMLRFTRQLAHVDTLQQQDSAERTLNKLARTYVMQMEALKRYRTGGEQKVTVQHVSVSEGGQAIVGNVTQGPPEATPQEPAKSLPALTDARQPAMKIIGKRERAPVALRRRQKDDGRSST
jgi:hypothetical protein